MELPLAYAVMGLDSAATLEEAKKGYRARAVLLHPDRVEGGLRGDAEAAMSQLNEAWEVVRAHLEGGGVTAGVAPPEEAADAGSSPRQHTRRPRTPSAGECDMCGYAPARPLRQRRIVGAVIAWRSGAVTLDLCRTCGSAYFTETQAQCLLKGWWGLLAVYATVPVLVRNWVHAASHRRHLAEPSSRDPSVVTPLPEPVLARPLRKRPLVYVTSSTALALLVLISTFAGSPSTDSSSPVAPPSPTTAGVGTCLTEGGRVVECSDDAALYKLTRPVANPDSCDGAAFQETTEEQWYCSTRVVG